MMVDNTEDLIEDEKQISMDEKQQGSHNEGVIGASSAQATEQSHTLSIGVVLGDQSDAEDVPLQLWH